LRSTDTIPGPRLAEGCSRKPKTACVAYRFSRICLSLSLRAFAKPAVVLTRIERFRVSESKCTKKDTNKSGRGNVRDVRAIVGRSSAFVAVVPRPCASRTRARYALSRSRETITIYITSVSLCPFLPRQPAVVLTRIERFRVGRRARSRIRIRAERIVTDLREC
jgi:hypothetical protein